MYISVNSQDIVIGSDDTSNDFTDGPASEYVPNADELEILSDHSDEFHDMAKQQESQRLSNADQADQMLVSRNGENDRHAILQEIEEDMHVELPVARWLRLQEEEEANTSGRLTAPQNEVRKRGRKRKSPGENDALIEDLRKKQMALVDDQIYLQKVLVDNAMIAREEAQEKLELIKIQRKIAQITLNELENQNQQ